MNICVVGLWHLGTTTAGCLASAGHQVTGLDFDHQVVDDLTAGRPPLFEPGLEDLVTLGMSRGRLRFTSDAASALAAADVVWVAYDTPVDEDDRADVGYVTDRVKRLFPDLRDRTLVLISAQVPVGTTRALEAAFAEVAPGRAVTFGYSPENLRLGRAIAAFTEPDRVVVGLRSVDDRQRVEELLKPFTSKIEWMSVESAEMTKHALNAFLATSITFINEIAAICEQVGADAAEVSRGLKSERRVSPNAPLSPGAAFAGGTLARDVVFLSKLGQDHGLGTHLLSSIKPSNDVHRRWAQRRLRDALGDLSGMRVAIWGLTYKPGTSTLRRSSAVELGEWLAGQGAVVRAHDPAIPTRPEGFADSIEIAGDPIRAAEGASALVVATPWPAFLKVSGAALAAAMARPLVLDEGQFLRDTLGAHPAIEYLTVGRPGR